MNYKYYCNGRLHASGSNLELITETFRDNGSRGYIVDEKSDVMAGRQFKYYLADGTLKSVCDYLEIAMKSFEYDGWIENEIGTVVAGKKPVGVIDLTPTWTGMLHPLVAVMQNGPPASQKLAWAELHKMATLADLYNKEKRS